MSTEQEQAGRPALRLADKAPRETEQPEKAKLPRQFVTFTFYKARPDWRALDPSAKLDAKREFVEVFDPYGRALLLPPSSLLFLPALELGLYDLAHPLLARPVSADVGEAERDRAGPPPRRDAIVPLDDQALDVH